MPATAPVMVIRASDRAMSLLDGTRRTLLAHLAEPDSAAGLARKLGLPRQRLNYHLRALEKAELVEFVEERRKGNCTERLVRASARAYVISPEVLGALGDTSGTAQDRFSAATLVAEAASVIAYVTTLRARAAQAGTRIATLTLATEIRFASATARNAFAEELTATVTKLAAKYDTLAARGARTFKLLAACYPARTGPPRTER